MKKKVVVLGGGNGLSSLLSGLKEFPIDLTAVVAVSDDGKSTGILSEELNIPAVGDVRRVIASLAETEPLVKNLMNYRFKTNSSLSGHTLGNLLLAGLIDVSGDFSTAIKSLSNVLNLKGTVLPLSKEKIVLKAKMEDGSTVLGEHKITNHPSHIKKLMYDKTPKILEEVIESLKQADLIVLSMGSLYTSIICNLINKEVIDAIDKSNAEILYVCNMMTQPGETDDYKVSTHINVLNNYLGKKKVTACLVNTGDISKEIIKRYSVLEQKEPVVNDMKNIKNVNFITDNFVVVEDETIKHNRLKLGFHIFAYAIR